MAEDIEVTRTAQPAPQPVPPAQAAEIKRTSGPETPDGTRWHVQLSGVPTREWLELFKVSARASNGMSPLIVVFDRASASYKSDEEHVEPWIESLDQWIATTDAKYRATLDTARQERTVRLDAEAEKRERIRVMNERFKNL